MAVVYPKPGTEREVAQALLALADDVMHVRTQTDDGFAFVVPEYLHERYTNGWAAKQEEEVPALSEDQVRRRPGRPRKTVPPKEGD